MSAAHRICDIATEVGNTGTSRRTEPLASFIEGRLRTFRFAPQPVILTTTQKAVSQCIACGLSDKEIAFFLGIQCATVKAHTSKILRMLGLFRRTQLVRFVFESGDFDPEMVEIEVNRRSMSVRRRNRLTVNDTPASDCES